MRVQITFFGMVQGVGFRFTALKLARRHKINGFVRNQSDGSVLLEAEASRESIGVFFSDLMHSMSGYIESTEYNRIDVEMGYSYFDIRY